MKPSYNSGCIKGDIFSLKPPKQTLKAWTPFWDCVGILFEFQNSEIADGEEELGEWRIKWVAGIALLRCIGHVLAKYDASTSEKHKVAISVFWNNLTKKRKENPIFWDFIDNERNNVLKTYDFGARFTLVDGEAHIIFRDNIDAFQLYREAVYWWRHHLMKIEAAL